MCAMVSAPLGCHQRTRWVTGMWDKSATSGMNTLAALAVPRGCLGNHHNDEVWKKTQNRKKRQSQSASSTYSVAFTDWLALGTNAPFSIKSFTKVCCLMLGFFGKKTSARHFQAAGFFHYRLSINQPLGTPRVKWYENLVHIQKRNIVSQCNAKVVSNFLVLCLTNFAVFHMQHNIFDFMGRV